MTETNKKQEATQNWPFNKYRQNPLIPALTTKLHTFIIFSSLLLQTIPEYNLLTFYFRFFTSFSVNVICLYLEIYTFRLLAKVLYAHFNKSIQVKWYFVFPVTTAGWRLQRSCLCCSLKNEPKRPATMFSNFRRFSFFSLNGANVECGQALYPCIVQPELDDFIVRIRIFVALRFLSSFEFDSCLFFSFCFEKWLLLSLPTQPTLCAHRRTRSKQAVTFKKFYVLRCVFALTCPWAWFYGVCVFVLFFFAFCCVLFVACVKYKSVSVSDKMRRHSTACKYYSHFNI